MKSYAFGKVSAVKIKQEEKKMKTGKRMIALVLVLLMTVAFVSVFTGCGFSSSSSKGSSSNSGKRYDANDADKNHDGNVSGKEFQDLVNEYLDDHGY